jgi:hypothetical protein
MPRLTDWKGITKTATGSYLVRVKVGRLPRAVKRYPAGTPLEVMQRWRDRARRELEEELETLPAAPRRGASPSNTLAADVQQYLKAWGAGKHPNTIEQRDGTCGTGPRPSLNAPGDRSPSPRSNSSSRPGRRRTRSGARKAPPPGTSGARRCCSCSPSSAVARTGRTSSRTCRPATRASLRRAAFPCR